MTSVVSINPATLVNALLQGLGVLVVVAGAYAWATHRVPEPEARAFAFATLVIATKQYGDVGKCRNFLADQLEIANLIFDIDVTQIANEEIL